MSMNTSMFFGQEDTPDTRVQFTNERNMTFDIVGDNMSVTCFIGSLTDEQIRQFAFNMIMSMTQIVTWIDTGRPTEEDDSVG